jgi:DNA ligase-1
MVVEVAFNDVQASPQYPGGMALRFARVKRYRKDKTAAVDTIGTVRGIFEAAQGGICLEIDSAPNEAADL